MTVEPRAFLSPRNTENFLSGFCRPLPAPTNAKDRIVIQKPDTSTAKDRTSRPQEFVPVD